MTLLNKVKSDLDQKFQKVLKTPASFDFFVAIHDFIKHIELNSSLSSNLSSRTKSNRDLRIPDKYNHLKEIYQGLEDSDIQSGDEEWEYYHSCTDANSNHHCGNPYGPG